MPHYLIVGNGAAGLSAAEIVRKRDPSGRVTIVTREPQLFYSRPGIAYYLMGHVPAGQLISRDAAFYRQHRLDLRHDTVVRLEPERQVAYLQVGGAVPYDVALLATGASAVPPPFPGGDLQGVVTFDSLDDATHIIRLARRARAAVVVGGGITAMELAEGLHARGLHVHFLQRRERLWSGLFTPEESAIVDRHVRGLGIDLHYQEEVAEVVGRRGQVAAVRLQSGARLPCHLVAVAIGVRPNLALVRELPQISRDRGILVDPHLQSSVPTLFAAGDVAQVTDRWTGRAQLDVLWPSAINEGRAAGHNMVDVAHGHAPAFPYEKGSPFNAALLFGLHLTVIGQVGSSDRRERQEQQAAAYLSRGASNVWTTPFGSHAFSAWDRHGPNIVRVAVEGGRLVGALLLGNQGLADPLRVLIEREVDVGPYAGDLLRGGSGLPALLRQIWDEYRSATPP